MGHHKNTDTKANERDRQSGAILDRHLFGKATLSGYIITHVNFKYRGADWLLIVKRVSAEGDKQVAFVQGDTPATCIRKAYNSFDGPGIRWRTDKPWQP